MTLSCLEVDLRGCFDYGQAYVALSRATSYEQLRVLNFSPSVVKAHPNAARFYETLSQVSEMSACSSAT
jgi:ATP-dependent DNA helicase PIF1